MGKQSKKTFLIFFGYGQQEYVFPTSFHECTR